MTQDLSHVRPLRGGCINSQMSQFSPQAVCHDEVGINCKHCEMVFHSFLDSVDCKLLTDNPVVEISTVVFCLVLKFKQTTPRHFYKQGNFACIFFNLQIHKLHGVCILVV